MSALQQQYAGRVSIIMVNVDSPAAGPYLSRYRVRGTPSFTLFDRHGHVAQSFVGWPGTAAVTRAFDQVAAQAGVAGRVGFRIGDAEALPFEDGAFDAVLCECAFCTFPDKARAASEMARVLRPGGRVGLSDLTRSGGAAPRTRHAAGLDRMPGRRTAARRLRALSIRRVARA